jgi:UDP:flavonoid glycosyltransferase YjiC (YdhE family)
MDPDDARRKQFNNSGAMNNVVFLFPNLTGHLNPSLGTAREFESKGFTVYYASTPDTLPFARKHGFDFHPLNSLPFAVGMDDLLHQNKKEKWLESLIDRHTDKTYRQRKADLEKMMETLNPAWIFLDEFFVTDFVILYQYLERRRIVVLHNKFPANFSREVPPLTTYAFPGKTSPRLWQMYFLKRSLREAGHYIKYLGKSDKQLLKRKWKENNIEERYTILRNKVFKPTFQNLEEWFPVDKQLDFPKQNLLPWQKYVQPGPLHERKEDISPSCQQFVEQAKSTPQNRLIYCSLGTVLKTHAKGKEKTVTRFFRNLIEIAEANPTLFFYVVVEKQMTVDLKPRSHNIKLAEYAPQLYLLKHADLFMTHAGLGSVKEGAAANVPMLLFPLNDKWDQNGNAARVVYHGLGQKADLRTSKTKLKKQIENFFDFFSPLQRECSESL